MSQLGIHFASSPRHDGFKAYLKQAADAGSPFAVVFALDQNIQPDIDAVSPQTVTVFRHQHRPNPNKDGLDDAPLGQGDPYTVGVQWFMQSERVFKLNQGFSFYSCTNELNPKTSDDHQWAAAYWLAQMQTADMLGRSIVWGNFSPGNPEPEDWITYYRECLLYSAQYGHVLGLHEYGLGYGSLRASADHGLALRYRTVYDTVLSMGLMCPQLLVSECGSGSYVAARDLEDVKWYDSQLMADKRSGVPLIGAALYQWGGNEAGEFAALMPALAQYVAGHPTIISEMVPFNGVIHRQYMAELSEYVTTRGGQVTAFASEA